MTITTKYNAGDEVWILSNGKAIQVKILGAHFVQTNYSDFTWDLHHIESNHTAKRAESEMYSTKEDLIKSL